MIIYLYFNYYHFTSKDFMDKLKVCNLKFGSQEDHLEIHLEENYYPYCRMKLNQHYLVDDVVKEFNNEIYKYILYP